MQKPLLIDLDGVLRIAGEPAKDLEIFLNFLEQNKIPSCILSNSSIHNSAQVYKFFALNSIEIKIPIITAIDAAYDFIKGKYRKVAVYVAENLTDMFIEFLDYENPEAILIGDIGDAWNYRLMQIIFEYLRNGSVLIAAHKNKFWEKPGKGIQLDAGPFIHALEYAASTNAVLIGKPSELYFHSALSRIGYSEDSDFIVIGDDLDSDMEGAKKIGAETILVLTGKTSLPISDSDKKNTDHIAENLLDVVKILKALY